MAGELNQERVVSERKGGDGITDLHLALSDGRTAEQWHGPLQRGNCLRTGAGLDIKTSTA